MRVLDSIIKCSLELYERTCGIPSTIYLPPRTFDALVAEAAKQTGETPRLIPGTTSCIQVDTGQGIVEVLCTEPERWISTPHKSAAQGDGK